MIARARSPYVAVLVGFAGWLSLPGELDAQTKTDFTTVPKRFARNSPSGGPAGHPGAAVCIVYRKAEKICWLEGGRVHFCPLKMPVQTRDSKHGGPTPFGEYLIGRRYKHPTNKIDWYKLYPRKEDDSGYYPYTAKTKTGRSAMGLHPGATSLGCATIKSSKSPLDDDPCWKELRRYLDAHRLTYKRSSYSGFLYVVNR